MCSQAPISVGAGSRATAAGAAAGLLRIRIVGDQHHDAAAEHRKEIAAVHARPPFFAADRIAATTRG